jgi:D-amino-acid dehydrogenase
MNDKAQRLSVAVIGAGIVGTCIAHALAEAGASVLLIDRDEPGRGASYGNSGAISTGSVAPVAMPGVIASAPKMLLDRKSPLHVPLAYLPRALPWLARFALAARPREIDRISLELAQLHRGAVEHHMALAAAIGAPELVVRRGHLHVYPDAKALDKDAPSWALRERHGIGAERLDRHAISDLEPAIAPRYTVGMFLADHAMVVNPFGYVQAIVADFTRRGGSIVRDDVRALTPGGAGSDRPLPDKAPRVWTIHGSQGSYDAHHVIVAAGAWSLSLVQPLGVRVALESQRGYHTTFKGVRSPVSRTVVLADQKIFATPMQDGLRVGGTVEIAGLRRAPDMRRAKRLAELARGAFSGLEGAEEVVWMGHRPCLPDSLPRVGPVAGHPGLWLAFGHGHLGLTDSANSARTLRAQLMGR